MKTKSQKKDELKKLETELPKANITVFTTFARAGEKGLSVGQTQELKRALRALNSSYVTAKKTLLEIALKDLKYPVKDVRSATTSHGASDGIDVYGMDGSLGLVVGTGDEYALTKKVYEFARKNQALKLFGALLDGKFITKETVLEMAMMPSREILLGRLLGMMTYPVRGLAVVLSQIEKQKS